MKKKYFITMLAAVLHGAKDLKLEPVADRPLAADEVRIAFRAGGICGRACACPKTPKYRMACTALAALVY